MSHLSKHKTKVTNIDRVRRLCFARNWQVEVNDVFTNSYSREKVNGGHIIRDSNGQTKMVIAPDGSVHTDAYFMGNQYEKFLQDYAADHLTEAAQMNGGMVTNQTVDQKTGDLLLEVQYM